MTTAINLLLPLLLGVTPNGAPPIRTIITHVRVEVGNGTTIPNATVVLAGGTIVSVRQSGSAGAAPTGMETRERATTQGEAAVFMDGTGKTLAPGFIESLTSLGLVAVSAESETDDSSIRGSGISPAFRAVDGFNPASPRIAIARAEGVTSIVTSPRGALIYGTGHWFNLTGEIAISVENARPAAMFGGIGGRAKQNMTGSRGGMWLLLRSLFDDAKVYGENRRAIDRRAYRQLATPPLQLDAMQPVLRGKIPMVLEVNRASDILALIRFSKENNAHWVIAGGAEAWMVASALAESKIPVILKPSAQVPSDFDRLAARDGAATLLHHAGVPLAFSSGDGGSNVRRLRQEAGIAVAYGLPHAAALRAISLMPALIFDRADRIGSVEAGKRANLVLWSGDPLEIDSVAERIWINGRTQSQHHRQRALAEKYLPTINHPE